MSHEQQTKAKTYDVNSSIDPQTAHDNRKAHQAMAEDYPEQGNQVPVSVTQLQRPPGTSSPNPPFFIVTQKATSDDDGSPVTRHSHHGSLTSSNDSPEESSRDARPYQRQYEYATAPAQNQEFQSAQSNAFQPPSPNAYQYPPSINNLSPQSTFIPTPNHQPQEPPFSPGLNSPAWPQGSYNWTPGYPPHGQGPPQFSPVPGYPPEAPHGPSYSHHNFNSDRPDIHQRGLTFPPHNINSPPQSATLPRMEIDRWDEMLPASRHIGYALIAAKLAGDTGQLIVPPYRRFRRLSHRLLLSYQVRIAELEHELYIQDSIEAGERGHGLSRVSDLEQRARADNGDMFLRNRFDVLDRIEDLLTKYNQLLAATLSIERCQGAAAVDVDKYKDLLARSGIANEETRLFNEKTDSFLFYPRRGSVSMAKQDKAASEEKSDGSKDASKTDKNQGSAAAGNFGIFLAIAMPLLAVWEPSWIVRCLFAVGCAFILFYLRFGQMGRFKEFMKDQLS